MKIQSSAVALIEAQIGLVQQLQKVASEAIARSDMTVAAQASGLANAALSTFVTGVREMGMDVSSFKSVLVGDGEVELTEETVSLIQEVEALRKEVDELKAAIQ